MELCPVIPSRLQVLPGSRWMRNVSVGPETCALLNLGSEEDHHAEVVADAGGDEGEAAALAEVRSFAPGHVGTVG